MLPQPALAEASPPSASISITDGGFNPANVTISAGQSVVWTNAGSAVHTATNLAGAFNSGGLGPGQSFRTSFLQPGTYQYTSATDCQNGNHNLAFNCSATVLVVGSVQPANPPATSWSGAFGDVARQLLAEMGNSSPDASQVQALVNWMGGEKPGPGRVDVYSDNPLNLSQGALRMISYSGPYSLPSPNAQPSNPIIQFPTLDAGVAATARFIISKATSIAALLTSPRAIAQSQLEQAVQQFRWGTRSFGALALSAPWVVPAAPTSTGGPPAFQPFWVESFLPTQLWSGNDSTAVSFGRLPVWSFLQVVAPSSGLRFFVQIATSGGVAYVDRAAVGPSGPPSSAAPPARPSSTPLAASPPIWVQNYKPTQAWSGGDANAIAFGQLPQWSYLQVVGPAAGSRLQVRVAGTGNVAYVDGEAVGPAGPPPSQPALQSTSVTPTSTRASTGTTRATVTVAAGDTLTKIAARLGTTVQTLVQLNGLPSPNVIRVGETLATPTV